MFLTTRQTQLTDDFAPFDDPHERLTAVIDRVKNRPGLSPSERIDAHRVAGCVSVVWLVGERRGDRCYFRSDAESPLVRGLVAFVCEFFSGAPAAEIVASDLDPLAALDLVRNLSPTRRNGLAAVRNAIRAFAQKSV